MNALVHLRKKTGARGGSNRRRARPGDVVWGMLHAGGIVSQSPEQLREMMGVIVVVCAAFDLTV